MAATTRLTSPPKNADALRGAFQDYIAASRKVGRKTGAAGKRNASTDAKEIRDWARSNGHEVPDRGRIPAEVRTAFESKM